MTLATSKQPPDLPCRPPWQVYGGKGVKYTEKAEARIAQYDKDPAFSTLPVCMSKTQYSLSDDANKLGAPKGFEVLRRPRTVGSTVPSQSLLLASRAPRVRLACASCCFHLIAHASIRPPSMYVRRTTRYAKAPLDPLPPPHYRAPL